MIGISPILGYARVYQSTLRALTDTLFVWVYGLAFYRMAACLTKLWRPCDWFSLLHGVAVQSEREGQLIEKQRSRDMAAALYQHEDAERSTRVEQEARSQMEACINSFLSTETSLRWGPRSQTMHIYSRKSCTNRGHSLNNWHTLQIA